MPSPHSETRIPYVYSTWNKMTDDKRDAICKQVALTLKKMQDGTL